MSPPPLSDRLLRVFKHPQFAWFLGHLFTALAIPLILLRMSNYVSIYYRALFGAMVAYGVVLYRHYKPTILSHGVAPTVRRLISDLNAHYLALAFYFWISAYPSLALLVPYTSFSIFHCLGYIKDILLPAIFPASADRPSPPLVVMIADRFATFSATYQPQALQLASYWEITLSPLFLLIEVLTSRQSFFTPLVYAQFMAARYLTSATTRAASTNVRRFLDSKLEPLANRPDALNYVGKFYIIVRNRVSAYLNARLPTPQPAASTQ